MTVKCVPRVTVRCVPRVSEGGVPTERPERYCFQPCITIKEIGGWEDTSNWPNQCCHCWKSLDKEYGNHKRVCISFPQSLNLFCLLLALLVIFGFN